LEEQGLEQAAKQMNEVGFPPVRIDFLLTNILTVKGKQKISPYYPKAFFNP
jgi:hypothetical protein